MALYERFRTLLSEESAVALTTVLDGPSGIGGKMLVRPDGSVEGHIDPPELACRIAGDAMRLLLEEKTDTIRYELSEGTWDVFLDAYPAPAQLIIVGAGHVAGPLSALAKSLGYRVIVTDARAAFAVRERFPEADQVLKGWPQDVLPSLRFDESTFVVLLSHDAKFDEPTLQHVLPTAVRYIGAIGSRRTQEQRFERLRNEGFTDEQLARIYGPVGLDLGARTAEETALAIIAELTAVRRGSKPRHLRDRNAAAHAVPEPVHQGR
jgi:xanthine dehydrogenase accessory factor